MTGPGGLFASLGPAGAKIAEVFGKGTIAEQFLMWNVASQLASPVLLPMVQSIANRMWSDDPNVPVSPQVMADLVARGLVTMDAGKGESVKSGVDDSHFTSLVEAARHAADAATAFALWRRGEIAEGTPGEHGATFYGALTEAGIRVEWQTEIAKLRFELPSGADALNAYLQGQCDEATARDLWAKAGMDPAYFQLMFDSNGTAPTPDMAGTMANRGIIPWDGTGPDAVSFQQAFLEGPWRNKWAGPMRRLMQYVPPPRTVTALVRAGAYTDAQALDAFRAYGLSKEDAAAMLADAHHGRQATVKHLARADVTALYREHKIDKATAEKQLMALGYSAADADLVLSMADVKKADTHVTAAVTRVRNLFVSHKITAEAALGALTSLGVPEVQRRDLIALWTTEQGVNVKQLTEAQIVQAFKKGIIPEADARTELHNIGYTPYDAWLLLSIAHGSALADKPSPGSGPGVNP